MAGESRHALGCALRMCFAGWTAERVAASLCAACEMGPPGVAKSAYIQSVGGPGPEAASLQDGEPGVAGLSAEARGLHPRVYADSEKAELGSAQSGAGA